MPGLKSASPKTANAAARARPQGPLTAPGAQTLSATAPRPGASACACGGGCPRCKRLTLGAPGDSYEQQADQLADRFVGALAAPMPAAAAASAGAKGASASAGAKGASAPAGAMGAAPPAIQRLPAGGAAVSSPTAPALAQANQVLAGAGQPLASAVRHRVEPFFSRDFGAVRVHTNAQAAASTAALGARAYTVGSQVVFGAGQFAPHSTAGLRLLAHELTHVAQQDGASPRIQRDLIFGSGFARPYSADKPETEDAEKGAWFPSSVDMQAGASNSGGGSGAGTVDSLIQRIKSKPVDSIDTLGIVGHSNQDDFALGGTIKPGDDVYFDADKTLNVAMLAAKSADIAALRNRFKTGARIVLYGCHAGAGGGLMDGLSNAFGVCVHGFHNEVSWCFKWTLPARQIFGRGRVFVQPPIEVIPGDPLPPSTPARPDCDHFLTDMRTLTTDSSSCVGVKLPTYEDPPLFPHRPWIVPIQ